MVHNQCICWCAVLCNLSQNQILNSQYLDYNRKRLSLIVHFLTYFLGSVGIVCISWNFLSPCRTSQVVHKSICGNNRNPPRIMMIMILNPINQLLYRENEQEINDENKATNCLSDIYPEAASRRFPTLWGESVQDRDGVPFCCLVSYITQLHIKAS